LGLHSAKKDEVLKTPPQFTLSDNFAEQVAVKAGKRFAWEQYFREYLLYLGVIAGILIISAGMSYFWLESNWIRWLELLNSNSAAIIGAVFLLLFVLFADKVLLRYFLNTSSRE
jgi:hypothetical protein